MNSNTKSSYFETSVDYFWRIQFLRFIFIGIINTIFGYCLFSLLIFLNLHYALASLIGTIIGIIFNFKTTGKFVFQNNNNKILWRFFGVYVILYLINIALLTIGTVWIENMYVNGAVCICITAGIGFVLNKYLVFEAT
jgi:putative flippase GtrA